MAEQAFHAKDVTMPLKTTRVQLAVMASVIRHSLDKISIIELRETGSREEKQAGWDSPSKTTPRTDRRPPRSSSSMLSSRVLPAGLDALVEPGLSEIVGNDGVLRCVGLH
jgi:hypothetical protein